MKDDNVKHRPSPLVPARQVNNAGQLIRRGLEALKGNSDDAILGSSVNEAVLDGAESRNSCNEAAGYEGEAVSLHGRESSEDELDSEELWALIYDELANKFLSQEQAAAAGFDLDTILELGTFPDLLLQALREIPTPSKEDVDAREKTS